MMLFVENGPLRHSENDITEILYRESDQRDSLMTAMEDKECFPARCVVQITCIVVYNNVTKSIHSSEVTPECDLV